ncbi:geranylgeranylglyceryl/heptaprenylglyceryl phosphate synthase [uncultured Lacinutrix sp.]|uniref:geranylgeranylglyceryl/heptaprenylglyceryl phosphate synthase n=1 Tax=uncultured Lacinutrix sp. TaxID=574032 RepID=UPI00262D1696|nr:geranylgeranylglyceryl/heptaprenylglyceryl phosphate synthase [uncultured Lacinutrix sp.]
MRNILKHIKTSVESKTKLLAVLIDPDKLKTEALSQFVNKVNSSIATHIFVGGSTVETDVTQRLLTALRSLTNLPIVLFPGDVTQISNDADAILFLSLVSGRNPEYLIGQHVKSVSTLRKTNLEVIPTGYILIDGGKETATLKVTKTSPLTIKSEIVDTAKAAELLGMKLIYLEAGSGAKQEVSSEIIKAVKQEVSIPLIVGGGIRNKTQLDNAYKAGADLVVIGTAFEKDESFFNKLK